MEAVHPKDALAEYTSFSLISAMLVYTSIHVLLEIDTLAASYPVTADIENDEIGDVLELHKQVMKTIASTSARWIAHFIFMIKLSFRIAGTLALLTLCAVILMAICNRYIVVIATQRDDHPLFSFKQDPSIKMTTLFAITKNGMSMLVSIALTHGIALLTSMMLIRPGNMRDLEKEIRPKLKMYLSILFVLTMLVIIAESIRIASRA